MAGSFALDTTETSGNVAVTQLERSLLSATSLLNRAKARHEQETGFRGPSTAHSRELSGKTTADASAISLPHRSVTSAPVGTQNYEVTRTILPSALLQTSLERFRSRMVYANDPPQKAVFPADLATVRELHSDERRRVTPAEFTEGRDGHPLTTTERSEADFVLEDEARRNDTSASKRPKSPAPGPTLQDKPSSASPTKATARSLPQTTDAPMNMHMAQGGGFQPLKSVAKLRPSTAHLKGSEPSSMMRVHHVPDTKDLELQLTSLETLHSRMYEVSRHLMALHRNIMDEQADGIQEQTVKRVEQLQELHDKQTHWQIANLERLKKACIADVPVFRQTAAAPIQDSKGGNQLPEGTEAPAHRTQHHNNGFVNDTNGDLRAQIGDLQNELRALRNQLVSFLPHEAVKVEQVQPKNTLARSQRIAFASVDSHSLPNSSPSYEAVHGIPQRQQGDDLPQHQFPEVSSALGQQLGRQSQALSTKMDNAIINFAELKDKMQWSPIDEILTIQKTVREPAIEKSYIGNGKSSQEPARYTSYLKSLQDIRDMADELLITVDSAWPDGVMPTGHTYDVAHNVEHTFMELLQPDRIRNLVRERLADVHSRPPVYGIKSPPQWSYKGTSASYPRSLDVVVADRPRKVNYEVRQPLSGSKGYPTRSRSCSPRRPPPSPDKGAVAPRSPVRPPNVYNVQLSGAPVFLRRTTMKPPSLDRLATRRPKEPVKMAAAMVPQRPKPEPKRRPLVQLNEPISAALDTPIAKSVPLGKLTFDEHVQTSPLGQLQTAPALINMEDASVQTVAVEGEKHRATVGVQWISPPRDAAIQARPVAQEPDRRGTNVPTITGKSQRLPSAADLRHAMRRIVRAELTTMKANMSQANTSFSKDISHSTLEAVAPTRNENPQNEMADNMNVRTDLAESLLREVVQSEVRVIAKHALMEVPTSQPSAVKTDLADTSESETVSQRQRAVLLEEIKQLRIEVEASRTRVPENTATDADWKLRLEDRIKYLHDQLLLNQRQILAEADRHSLASFNRALSVGPSDNIQEQAKSFREDHEREMKALREQIDHENNERLRKLELEAVERRRKLAAEEDELQRHHEEVRRRLEIEQEDRRKKLELEEQERRKKLELEEQERRKMWELEELEHRRKMEEEAHRRTLALQRQEADAAIKIEREAQEMRQAEERQRKQLLEGEEAGLRRLRQEQELRQKLAFEDDAIRRSRAEESEAARKREQALEHRLRETEDAAMKLKEKIKKEAEEAAERLRESIRREAEDANRRRVEHEEQMRRQALEVAQQQEEARKRLLKEEEEARKRLRDEEEEMRRSIHAQQAAAKDRENEEQSRRAHNQENEQLANQHKQAIAVGRLEAADDYSFPETPPVESRAVSVATQVKSPQLPPVDLEPPSATVDSTFEKATLGSSEYASYSAGLTTLSELLDSNSQVAKSIKSVSNHQQTFSLFSNDSLSDGELNIIPAVPKRLLARATPSVPTDLSSGEVLLSETGEIPRAVQLVTEEGEEPSRIPFASESFRLPLAVKPQEDSQISSGLPRDIPLSEGEIPEYGEISMVDDSEAVTEAGVDLEKFVKELFGRHGLRELGFSDDTIGEIETQEDATRNVQRTPAKATYHDRDLHEHETMLMNKADLTFSPSSIRDEQEQQGSWASLSEYDIPGNSGIMQPRLPEDFDST
ncbi:hypothetical protein BC832DRAFT_340523 [Gaertneriomyces semiglobifer]|nr:hypothetical protein BC832DRAFT_340523 [Gaertneriomyces semiglobifer]